MLSVKHLMAGIGHSLFNPSDNLDDPLLSPMDSEEDSVDTSIPTEASSKAEYGTFNSNSMESSAYSVTDNIDGIVAAINPPELRVTASEGSTSAPVASPRDAIITDTDSEDEIIPVKEELEYGRPHLNRFSSLFTANYDNQEGYASSDGEWKEDGGIKEEGNYDFKNKKQRNRKYFSSLQIKKKYA